MSTRYPYAIVLLGLVLLVPCTSQAAVQNALSCSVAHVQAAVDAAATGDTVHLPTCTYTGWASTVNINKRIILEGNGRNNTILNRDDVFADFFVNFMFKVTAVTGFEMRELTIDGTQDTNQDQWEDGGIWLEDCVDFRLHHMNIQDLAQGILVRGNPELQRGLIDHNTFTDNYCSPNCGGTPNSLGYGIHVVGRSSYQTLSLGTAQNVFIEDNIFNENRHNVAANNGARYVFRHNDIQSNGPNAAAVDAHGYVTGWTVGTRQYEIYRNLIQTVTSDFAGIGIRGGDGVIWENEIGAASSNRDIFLTSDYVHNGSNTQTCPVGRPTPYQIRDLYIWGNTRIGGGAAQVVVDSDCVNNILLNTDYRLAVRPLYGTGYTYPHPGQGGVSPVPDFASSLRMHLKFDEGTLTTAQDSTVNNHDGTLVNGATWGAATLGASALSLDGTDDHVAVTGLLSSPAALTLAAWVLPSTYGTGGSSDVVSVGNVVTLRVSATQVSAHYWNGTAFTTLAGTRPTGSTWQHVAYTATAGAQRLYVNGGLVASGSAGAALNYTGQGTDTRIGTHGNAGAVTRFGGLIDDVRVYTRALTANDIDGLANLDDPPPLSVLITTPVNGPSYSTSSAFLANLGGIANDDTGVTGITWNCPSCSTTSGSANCTPVCGAVATSVNWNIPAITLAPGNNLITVTATDASGTAQDTLTVTYTVPPVAGACTYYASPTGSGNGLSSGSPFQIVTFWSVAGPNATLCLLDGTYTGGNSMVQPPADLAGTMSQPITIQAVNDGAALLDGQHARNPVVVGSTNQWFVVQGLNARNGLTAVYQFLGSNNRGARLAGWVDAATPGLGSIFTVTGTNTVVEDAVGWGPKTQVIFQGSGTVSSPGSGYRRTWCEWESLPPGSTTLGACYRPGKDQRLENAVGTLRETD